MANSEQLILKIANALKFSGFKASNITPLPDRVLVNFDSFGMSMTVTPATSNPPGRKVMGSTAEAFKSLNVTYTKPQLPTEFPPIQLPSDLKTKGHYSLYFKSNDGIRFSFKMKNDLLDYANLNKQLVAIQEKFGELAKTEAIKKEEATQKLKKKMEKRRQEREGRIATYEKLQRVLNNGFPGQTESLLEGEFVNLTLNNKIKIRLQAEPNGVFITDLELNKELQPDQVVRFLHTLVKSGV